MVPDFLNPSYLIDQVDGLVVELNLEYVVIAVLCSLVMQLLRARAWVGALRAAYPARGAVKVKEIVLASFAGSGLAWLLPARGGDLLKVFLAKKSIPRSNFVTTASSYGVYAPFDLAAGLVVFAIALQAGMLSHLPLDFDGSFIWKAVIVALVIGVVAYFVHAKARKFWAHITQGFAALKTPSLYFKGVLPYQAAGWCFRTASTAAWLAAFGIDPSWELILTIFSVQGALHLIPVIPGGYAINQALLVLAIPYIPAAQLVGYSVASGMILHAVSFVIAVICLGVIFGHWKYREVLAEARAASETVRKALKKAEEKAVPDPLPEESS